MEYKVETSAGYILRCWFTTRKKKKNEFSSITILNSAAVPFLAFFFANPSLIVITSKPTNLKSREDDRSERITFDRIVRTLCNRGKEWNFFRGYVTFANGLFAKYGIHAAICRRCRFPIAYVCAKVCLTCLRDVRESSLHTSIYSILTHLALSLSLSLSFCLCLSSFHFISFRFGSQRSAVGNLLSAAAPPKAERKFALNQIRWNFLSVICTYRGRPGLAACFRLVLLSMMNLRWPRKLRNSESAGVTKTDVRQRTRERVRNRGRERERMYERDDEGLGTRVREGL